MRPHGESKLDENLRVEESGDHDMTTETKHLVFRTWQENHFGYPQTFIQILRACPESCAARRDGAVDNKDGYGSAETAQSVYESFKALVEMGHETHYDRVLSYEPCVTIRWQHYGETEFCRPNFEQLGGEFSLIEKGMDMLREIGRGVAKARQRQRSKECGYPVDRRDVRDSTFDDPNALLAVLRRRKDAVECEKIPMPGSQWNTVLVPKKRAAAKAA